MKKRLLVLYIVIACVGCILGGCGKKHEHVWAEADCENPKTCSECGEIEGVALGHKWEEATCVKRRNCSVCGKTEGEKLGHSWIEATCTESKVCSVCNEKEGVPLGHTVDIGYCDNCGELVGGQKAELEEVISLKTFDVLLNKTRWNEEVIYEPEWRSLDDPVQGNHYYIIEGNIKNVNNVEEWFQLNIEATLIINGKYVYSCTKLNIGARSGIGFATDPLITEDVMISALIPDELMNETNSIVLQLKEGDKSYVYILE